MAMRYCSGVRPPQAGIALLTVLLVVFLASVAAVALASVQQFAIRRSTLLLHQQQAQLYVLGAEQWAAAILQRDGKDNDIDHNGEDWASVPPALPVEGGSVSGRIMDLQGRFNLNNLVTNEDETDAIKLDELQLEVFKRLLENLDLNPALADAVADWIDPDQEVLFPDGAEDGDYLNNTPPYLAANRALQSISELRLIKGVNQEIYARLVPYVAVLPTGTRLNVNTAPAAVLAALSDEFKTEAAQALVQARESYDNVESFLQDAQLLEAGVNTDMLTVSSAYFLVQAEAYVGEAHASLQSVVQRQGSGIRVVMRSFGSDN